MGEDNLTDLWISRANNGWIVERTIVESTGQYKTVKLIYQDVEKCIEAMASIIRGQV